MDLEGKNIMEAGIPQIGSCWGIQLANYAAGGKVEPHPKGREMGIATKIRLTEEGKKHPMFNGKPEVYSHFVSHDDSPWCKRGVYTCCWTQKKPVAGANGLLNRFLCAPITPPVGRLGVVERGQKCSCV